MHEKIKVVLSSKVEKQLKRLPYFILESLESWKSKVLYLGIYDTRKIASYHDEPLQGERFGQRSVRLNKAYRLIYILDKGEVLLLTILDISKHKY